MDELTLQEEGHIYRLGGRRIISTTQAIDILDERRKDPYYLLRGKLIHLATAYYDRNELDFDSIADEIKGFFDAYISFQKATGFKPQLIEHRLYHKGYVYAGTIDRIGPLNANLSIIDLKSGVPARVDELQGTAYWELCRVNNIPIKKVFDLYLHADGTYKLEPLKKKPKLLLPVFLAALTLKRWSEKL